MSPEDLTADEHDLLIECCDTNLDFQQLIYNIHFTYTELDIWDKYQKAFNLIVSSIDKGSVEVLKVDYKVELKDGVRHQIPISYELVSTSLLRTMLKNPWLWQVNTESNLEIAITSPGESILKRIMAN